MCYIDLEPCEVWEERERKARKEHRCSCCHGAILAGQVYLVHFSVFEGTATSGKMCTACRDDRATFAADHDGTLCTPSYFPQMLRECIGEFFDEADAAHWKAMLGRINGRS